MALFIIRILLKILLILVCILAALIALLLFVPFRYDIRAVNDNPERYEEFPGMVALERFSAEGRIRWLFGFFSASFQYRRETKERHISVKILWLRLPVEKFFSRGGKRKEETVSEEKKPSPGFFERVRALRDKFDKYQKVLCSRCAGRAFSFIKEQLMMLLAAVLPDEWYIRGDLGAGDPAATGKIIQFISFIYPFSPESVQTTFDFEAFRVNLELKIRGRIRMFTVLVHALKILFNKDVRKVFRALKAIRNGKAPAQKNTKPEPAQA